MASALGSGLAMPPAPDIAQGGALTGGAPQQSGAPGAPQPQQQPVPAPTHAQTVAALRHFNAIGKQLEGALKDPDLGKSDIKSKVIDGMTRLVADRMISPGQAVSQLATFPERPFDQKKWLMTHMAQLMQARNAVLSHHGTAFAGQPPQPTPSADSHMQDIAGMMQGHYARS